MLTSNRILFSMCQWKPFKNVQCLQYFVPKCRENRLRLSTLSSPKPDWNRAVSEAEKIVGYPTSFANLRWLLSDEIANVALHLRKLVGSNHPILKTAKNLLYNGKNNMQAWGLLMLLVSKAAGHTSSITSADLEDEGVLHSQRILAELTEIIRTGHLVHKGLVNISLEDQIQNKDNMNFGNKIALLTGDFLLVKANSMLSNLRNQHLSELISSALRDLTDGEFFGERDPQNFPVPSKPKNNEIIYDMDADTKLASLVGCHRRSDPLDPAECAGNPVREWTLRNVSGGGSLLGKGCEGALYLAGHDRDLQDTGYKFGCHIALAWQACIDYDLFVFSRADTFSLVCAPVLFALHDNPNLYDQVKCASQGIDFVDYTALKESVKKGPALENTMVLYREHSKAAMAALEMFPDSVATNALKNILLAMNDQ